MVPGSQVPVEQGWAVHTAVNLHRRTPDGLRQYITPCEMLYSIYGKLSHADKNSDLKCGAATLPLKFRVLGEQANS